VIVRRKEKNDGLIRRDASDKGNAKAELNLALDTRQSLHRNYMALPCRKTIASCGWWIDAENPDDMIEANRLVLQRLSEANVVGDVDSKSDVRIVHSERRPRSHKLILSDNSAGEIC
jgi:hypothetical protein